MGNQMFQYAFAKSISLKYNVPMSFDLSFLKANNPRITKRDYDLDLFNCDVNFFEKSKIKNKIHQFREPHFPYSLKACQTIEKLLTNNKKENVFVGGFWQSFKYFKDYEFEIKKDFKLKKQSLDPSYLKMLNKIKNSNSVSINVRRNDYLKNNFHGVMTVEYYQDAVNYINSKVKNPHYFISGDDMDWAKKNLKFKNSTFIDNINSYTGDRFGDKFELIRNCKHFIIPNSTFSWWSAYLSENDHKEVVAPIEWFSSTTKKLEDLLLPNWHTISKSSKVKPKPKPKSNPPKSTPTSTSTSTQASTPTSTSTQAVSRLVGKN